MNEASTAQQNATAIASIQNDLEGIIASFQTATKSLPEPEQKKIVTRQTPVEDAIPELETTLDDLFQTVKLLIPVAGPGKQNSLLTCLQCCYVGRTLT